MRSAFLAALLALAALTARGEAAPAKPVRVLFIGNSLTSVTDIPERFAKLAGAMGKRVAVDSVAPNEYSLEDHWHDKRTQAALARGWDVVVLQQGTSAHPEGRQQLVEYTARFAAAVRAGGGQVALYMVWPLSDRPRDFAGSIGAYRAAAKAVDGILVPVGEAWLRALSADRRLRLYGDAIHPSSLGSDLAVLTIYLSLFPAGPQEFDEAYVERIARELGIPAARRDLFFDAATRAIDEPMRLQGAGSP